MQKINIHIYLVLVLVSIYLSGCARNNQPNIKEINFQLRFKEFIKKYPSCIAKKPVNYRSYGERKGNIYLDFSKFPKKIKLNRYRDSDYRFLVYDDLIVYDNIVVFKHSKYGTDYKFKIKLFQENKLIINFGEESYSYDRDIVFTCENSDKIVMYKADEIKKFENSPFSDKELKEKLKKQLRRKVSDNKFEEIKKLVKYGVYISHEDIQASMLRKSMSSKYVSDERYTKPDYRVFQFLLKNSGLTIQDIMKKIKGSYKSDKYADVLKDTLVLKSRTDEDDYSFDELSSNLAFAKYFSKLPMFKKALKDIVATTIRQNMVRSYKSSYRIPSKTREFIEQLRLSRSKSYDENIKFLLLRYDSSPSHYHKKLINTLNSLSKKDSKYLNNFLSYSYQFLKLKGEYHHVKYKNEFKLNALVLKEFLKKGYRPDEATIKLYSQIKNEIKSLKIIKRSTAAYRETKIKRITDRITQYQNIINILDDYGLSKQNKIRDLNLLLSEKIINKDVRGASFYIKKGAVGNEKMLLNTIYNDMAEISKKLLLQSFDYNSYNICKAAIKYKRNNIISFMLENNKLTKNNLEELVVMASKLENSELIKKFYKYGANQKYSMNLALKTNNKDIIYIVSSNAGNNEKRRYKEYLLKKKLEKEKAEKERKIRKAKALKIEEKRKENERKAYNMKKNIGNKICRDGRILLGLMGVRISGYVENIKNNNIKIRITDTERQNPIYNGTKLYQNTIIWDKYYNWKHCE